MVFAKNTLMMNSEKEKVFEREIDLGVVYGWIFVSLWILSPLSFITVPCLNGQLNGQWISIFMFNG